MEEEEEKAKPKKELTPTQRKRRYKAIQWTCFGGEFVSVFAPFIAIGIANYDKYFVEYDGVRMSIAAAMALAVMGLATWLVAKKKFENSFITLIVGWATATFVFYMMGEMITDLSTIMLFGLIGICGAYGLDIGSKKAEKKAKAIQEGIDQAKKEGIAEDYKEELKKRDSRKVKVRIRK